MWNAELITAEAYLLSANRLLNDFPRRWSVMAEVRVDTDTLYRTNFI